MKTIKVTYWLRGQDHSMKIRGVTSQEQAEKECEQIVLGWQMKDFRIVGSEECEPEKRNRPIFADAD